MSFLKLGVEIWRDYVLDGVPASGAHDIIKSDMRAWMAEAESAAQSIGTIIPAGDGVTDYTSVIQAALNADQKVGFVGGHYPISDELLLDDDQQVVLGPNVQITQTTANKRVFFGNGKENAWIFANGALLEGEGTYDGNVGGAWTGNGGHNDRGIEFFECVGGGVLFPRITNCGNAGICIRDSQGQTLVAPKISGTGTVTSQGNFQNGILIRNEAAVCTDITIIGGDVTDVAQGVLDEAFPSLDYSTRRIVILGMRTHGIPGQHAYYLQQGGIVIASPNMADIELAGVKVQCADSNANLRRLFVTGAVAKNLGGNLFEVVRINGFTGIISDVIMEGTCDGADRLISIGGPVRRSSFKARGTEFASAVVVAGDDVTDVDIDVTASEIDDDGILVTATNSTIRMRPVIRNPNKAGTVAGASGVRVTSASAVVELFDPVATDANGNMNYGLYNETSGSVVKVRGSGDFRGATDTAVRATGVVSEFPTEATLQGTNGEFTMNGRVQSSQAMLTKVTSTSASNVVLWVRELDDESAYKITAEIVGKLSTSAERAAYHSTVLVYRDGGSATIQGTADTLNSEASGSFAGAFSWAVSGNTIELRVNSGGAATYSWRARVTVVPIT